jgi:hypothetical protein
MWIQIRDKAEWGNLFRYCFFGIHFYAKNWKFILPYVRGLFLHLNFFSHFPKKSIPRRYLAKFNHPKRLGSVEGR